MTSCLQAVIIWQWGMLVFGVGGLFKAQVVDRMLPNLMKLRSGCRLDM